MEGAASKRHWRDWVNPISVINLVLLALGVLGFWRDRVVVNETKLEQQTVTLGEIKNDVAATRNLAQKASTDMEVLKERQTSTTGRVDGLERRVDQVEDDQQKLTDRVGVLEQRQRR